MSSKRHPVFAVLVLSLACLLPAWSGQPVVSMSTPDENTLCRANVMVFGTAYVPGDPDGLDHWRLDYGAGRHPTQWTEIKTSDRPVTNDPWPSGKVFFNPNSGAHGNLGDWTVGLTAYKYARTWRANLNGLYTLRLTAVAQNGQRAEIKRRVMVGQAIVRTDGGTANSSDFNCRLAIYPFSFDHKLGRVVAIIKQQPPESLATLGKATGTEDTSLDAQAVYQTVPPSLQLLGPIYRLYPNGMTFSPTALLEMNHDPEDFRPRQPGADFNPQRAAIYLWDPLSEHWGPLPTQWHGQTASTRLPQIPEYFAYVALMQRQGALEPPRVVWQARTALQGQWVGLTEPRAQVQILNRGKELAAGQVNQHGKFTIPAHLQPGVHDYTVQTNPLGQPALAGSTTLRVASGEVVEPQAPLLSLNTEPKLIPNQPLLLLCDDPGLAEPGLATNRALLATLSSKDLSRKLSFELTEAVPGSGKFLASLPPDRLSPKEQALWRQFSEGEALEISLGPSKLALEAKDIVPPRIELSSPSHPSLLYLSAHPDQPKHLIPSRRHSPVNLALEGNHWQLSGLEGQSRPSARIAFWPISSYPASSWPLIGFSYQLQEEAPWQLMLSSRGKMRGITFGEKESWFPPLVPTPPLVADGQWQRWQHNLAAADLDQIDTVLFGSWLKGAFKEAKAGFPHANRGAIRIKDLWIGRTYEQRTVKMEWQIHDASDISQLQWWVDQQPDSKEPKQSEGALLQNKWTGAAPKSGSCHFTLPSNGQWYFHLQALDAAGNAAGITSYPLAIADPNAPQLELPTERTTNTNAIQVTWKQPDGSFDLPLKGFGHSLLPSSLVLHAGETSYPLKDPLWNGATEVLTVDKTSFKDGIPLGLNGETLPVYLTATDTQGRELNNLPAYELQITSPFELQELGTGKHRLKVVGAKAKNNDTGWRAYWKHPMPPWAEHFPKAICNTLVVCKPTTEKKGVNRERGITFKWERRFDEAPESVLWQEQFNAPTKREADLNNSEQLATYGSDGSTLQPAKTKRPDKDTWLFQQNNTDPFEKQQLRVIVQGDDLTIQRANIRETLALLRQQKPDEDIRLDGWLPPHQGYLALTIPEESRLLYAVGESPRFVKASGNQLRLNALDEWSRFSILIKPSRFAPRLPTISLKGVFYW